MYFFLQNLPTMNDIGPYFLSHVVLRFSPSNLPERKTSGFSPNEVNELRHQPNDHGKLTTTESYVENPSEG
jgi:hypothetical protein